MKENGTLWGRTARTTRGLTAMGALSLALLVWTGTTMALTTAPQGDGGTNFSDTSCTALAVAPASQNVEHTDGDDVLLPMYEHWNDLRPSQTPPIAGWTSRFQVVADYQGTQSNNTHDHTTYGASGGSGNDYVNLTVPDVSESTSMDVTYNVWVYDDVWSALCSDSDTTTFAFV